MPHFRKMRIGTLAVVLLLALAMVGVGYGLWSKTLFINGTVRTGNVDAELSLEAVEEDEDKDVARCSAELRSTNQDNDTLVITIDNGYPSFVCRVTFDVHSTGTIPVHVRRPVWSSVPPKDAVSMDLQDCYDDGFQLHQSERALCTIWMHVEQGAKQGDSYTFAGTVLVHQFNEEP